MEFRKIASLFDTAFDDKSEKNCNVNKDIRIKTSILRSHLCDCVILVMHILL